MFDIVVLAFVLWVVTGCGIGLVCGLAGSCLLRLVIVAVDFAKFAVSAERFVVGFLALICDWMRIDLLRWLCIIRFVVHAAYMECDWRVVALIFKLWMMPYDARLLLIIRIFRVLVCGVGSLFGFGFWHEISGYDLYASI
eukprot:gene3568-2519_t